MRAKRLAISKAIKILISMSNSVECGDNGAMAIISCTLEFRLMIPIIMVKLTCTTSTELYFYCGTLLLCYYLILIVGQ